jgi:hypothetical protein
MGAFKVAFSRPLAVEVKERITPVAEVRKHLNGLVSISRTLKIHCGSWLACDSGVSVPVVLADSPSSQASQLPHFDLYQVRAIS